VILKTPNLTLVPQPPQHLLALGQGEDDYRTISGVRVAGGVREFLLAASPDFFAKLHQFSEPDPWRFGFAVVHTAQNLVIGLCGFTGTHRSDGIVEIAYSIAPDYQGKGYAMEVAQALVEFASRDARVRTIRAHTLPEKNASTRILEKCGFQKAGETIDPETSAAVWRWEKPAE
jgi:RimJ/RimL family protein N-acetyltransferase